MKRKISISALCLLLLGASCNTDNERTSIGSGILGEVNYQTLTQDIPLEISNIKLKNIQTNALASYALGQLSQADFGQTSASIASQVLLPNENPTFGVLSASQESASDGYNENETVEKVYLYLPFFSSLKKNTNNSNTETYKLDSIYGNPLASFTLKVQELNYYLREVGTDLNTESFFSDQNLPVSSDLATVNGLTLSPAAIVRRKFDNPTTPEVDESEEERDQLPPGIRIELDKNFFQTKILNKEGSAELSNNSLFTNFLRGIVISASHFSDDIWAIVNLHNAKIEIEYSFLRKIDGKDYTQKTSTELNLVHYVKQGNSIFSEGIALNTFSNANSTATPTPETFLLKGNLGYVLSVKIPEVQMQKLKEKSILINDASLMVYVKEAFPSHAPLYLLAYNAQTGGYLLDYSSNSASFSSGKLQKDSQGNLYYRIGIGDHLARAISNGENPSIGIALSQGRNSASLATKKYTDTNNQSGYAPAGSVESPFALKIHSDQSPEQDFRLKLRLTYSVSK